MLKNQLKTHSLKFCVDKEGEDGPERVLDIPLVDNKQLRWSLISRIEGIVLNVFQQISSGGLPNISYTVPDNCGSIESQKMQGFENDSEEIARKTVVDFSTDTSKNKFSLIMTMLGTIHRLLIANVKITRRSLYYNLRTGVTSNLAPDQRYVDQSVNHIARLLNCAPWELNLVPTSKGLAAGELILSLHDDSVIDCRVPGGALIPQLVSNIISIRTRAKFVLIVEKDAIFQKLLAEKCTLRMNCILLTGKGYPDVATRMLVKLLSERADLPTYIVVDADPFGVDIMCIYRFGSAVMSKENESLACSRVRWLGIHPSELIGLGVKTVPLTRCDLSKLAVIESRSYLIEEAFSRELGAMRGGKAEIEGIFSRRQFFAINYLKPKIEGDNYI